MARVTLTPTALVANGGVADPAGTASVAGAGNGFTIAAPTASNVNLWLRVANASGGSGTISVLAGSQPLAISSGLGPVTVTVANSSTQWVGPFDSSRVVQNDGSLTIETSVVMTVAAFTPSGNSTRIIESTFGVPNNEYVAEASEAVDLREDDADA